MDFHRMAVRVASRRIAAVVPGMSDAAAGVPGSAMVHVTEDDHRVTVTYRGKTHAGTWTEADEESGDHGFVEPDPGSDEDILQAAMTLWSGEDDFQATADQLMDTGHWGNAGPAVSQPFKDVAKQVRSAFRDKGLHMDEDEVLADIANIERSPSGTYSSEWDDYQIDYELSEDRSELIVHCPQLFGQSPPTFKLGD